MKADHISQHKHLMLQNLLNWTFWSSRIDRDIQK